MVELGEMLLLAAVTAEEQMDLITVVSLVRLTLAAVVQVVVQPQEMLLEELVDQELLLLDI